MDDKPDFSSYDYEALLDVVEHIDPRKYPKRKREVEDLIVQRMNAPETLQQLQQSSEEKRYDTFFQRLFAYLVDSLVLWIPSSIIAALMLSSSSLTAAFLAIAGELVVLTYYILFHWRTGQTIGKKIFAVRVSNNENEGSISLQQAVMREIFPLVAIGLVLIASLFLPGMHSIAGLDPGEPSSFQSLAGSVLLVWALLEILTMLFHDRNRALHDLIAGTVVVNELPPQT